MRSAAILAVAFITAEMLQIAKRMTEFQQLPLDLSFRPALGRADFVVGASNADAVAWIDRWPDWPLPALALFGPDGSGKSHLAAVWQSRVSAHVISGPMLREKDLVSIITGSAVIEDVDHSTDERALFHLMNAINQNGHYLLLTARHAPAHWPFTLPDLVSRLKALPVTTIGAPDDTLIHALLKKLFQDRQLRIEDDVLHYLVPRMERSCLFASRLVSALDAMSLSERRNITVALAREVLQKISDPC